MLSTAEIKRFIDEDAVSDKKKLAAIGQRYYEANHDILECRMFYYNTDGVLVEDTARANVKISHPFFTELSDQLAAHILAFDENPIRAKEHVEGLQDQLDTYFDEEFWSEMSDLITGTYNKGFDYIFGYQHPEDRLAFQYADSMGVVEVRAKDTDDNCEYIIYWYIDRIDKGHKKIKRIQVWDDKETAFFVQVDDGEIEKDGSEKINPKPHVLYQEEGKQEITYENFGFIPFWRLDNNRKQISGLKPIKPIIDDYDVHACSLTNNLIDFDTPLHVVSGFQGDNMDELQQNLKTKKMIGVDEGGGVSVQTVDIPYQARKEKLDIDEKAIYRFGMGLNTAGLKDTSATTNLAIKAAYTLLDMKAKKLLKRVKKLLRELLKPVLAEVNEKNGTDYQLKDIEFNFPLSILTNDTENIQNEKTKADIRQVQINTILNVAEAIGSEQALRSICEVLDLDYQEIKSQVEKLQAEATLATAKQALEQAAIEPPAVDPAV